MQYTLLQEHCAFISYPLRVGQEKKLKHDERIHNQKNAQHKI
jgi:hypothetical protein